MSKSVNNNNNQIQTSDFLEKLKKSTQRADNMFTGVDLQYRQDVKEKSIINSVKNDRIPDNMAVPFNTQNNLKKSVQKTDEILPDLNFTYSSDARETTKNNKNHDKQTNHPIPFNTQENFEKLKQKDEKFLQGSPESQELQQTVKN